MPEIEIRELKIENLLVICDKCNGTGDPNSPGPVDYQNFGTQGGSGGLIGYCVPCKGSGATLTPSGEAVRDFVYWLNRTGQIGSRS